MAKQPAKKSAAPKATKQPEPAEVSPPIAIARPVLRVPLNKIKVPPRLRAVDEGVATGIADSMTVNGQQTPIEITPPDADGFHDLVAGAHRLRAVKINEWTEIDATVFKGSPTECRLREIDENLIRRELSPLDRAVFLAERKKIYEELYPETKAGTAGAVARWHATAKLAFASETAERCGISERAVRLAIHRFNRIAPDIREKIALTWIADKGVELDALAKLEPDEQRKAIELLFSENEGAPKSINEASKVVRGIREQASNDEKDADFIAFTRKWDKGIYSAQTKRNIIAWLEAGGHLADASGELAEVA